MKLKIKLSSLTSTFAQTVLGFFTILAIFWLLVHGAWWLSKLADEEIKDTSKKYIEIQLGDKFKLKEWEWAYTNDFEKVVIIHSSLKGKWKETTEKQVINLSYVGLNEQTNKSIKVIKESVTLPEMESVISKDGKRLEAKLEKEGE